MQTSKQHLKKVPEQKTQEMLSMYQDILLATHDHGTRMWHARNFIAWAKGEEEVKEELLEEGDDIIDLYTLSWLYKLAINME